MEIVALGGANYLQGLNDGDYEWEARRREIHNSSELTAFYNHRIEYPSRGKVYKDLKTYTPYVAETYDKVMNDRLLYRYWYLKDAGRILPVNPCTISEVTREFSPISYQARIWTDRHRCLTTFQGDDPLRPADDYLPLSGVDQELVNNMVTQCVTKARSKCDSSSVQALVTFGEAKQTINMVKRAAGHLVLFVKSAKNYVDNLVALNKATKITAQMYKDVESAWMEARFGWRPFYHEVGNIIDSVMGLREFYDRHRFRAGGRLQGLSNKSLSFFSTQFYDAEVKKETQQEISISSGILCTQRYGGTPDTFGITKVPYTLWELTPCSWLIDYYFNVGNYLKASTPDTLFQPQVAWLTKRTRTIYSIQTQNFVMKAPLYEGWATGGFRRKTVVEYERICAEGIPSGIVFRLSNVGLAKTMDTVAVARQKFASLLSVLKRVTR